MSERQVPRSLALDRATIETNLRKYLECHGKAQGVKPLERYASFDYCFNYFQSFYEERRIDELASARYMQESCLQLGFYLASWGMLRGSSFLLNKSMKVYEPVIRMISNAHPNVWETDVHRYSPENIRLLIEFKESISHALDYTSTDTLATKIMLGVFGNVPAFDSYFKKGFGVSTFGKRALNKVAHLYQAHSLAIEKYRVPTLDFHTGQPTNRRYSRAKVIDMVFFVEGSERGLTSQPSSGQQFRA